MPIIIMFIISWFLSHELLLKLLSSNEAMDEMYLKSHDTDLTSLKP